MVTFIYLYYFSSRMDAYQPPLREERSLSDILSDVGTALADTFFPYRTSRMLAIYEHEQQWKRAGDCAAKLGKNTTAFTYYERDGSPEALQEAAFLAQSLGDYHRERRYWDEAGDFIEAGFASLQVGEPAKAIEYWKRVLNGEEATCIVYEPAA